MKFKHTILLSRKDVEKGLRLPEEMSPELAELIGIHFGDGSMSKSYRNTYRIMISFNMRDRSYAEYVKELFLKVFNISMKQMEFPYRNEIELYVLSKSVCTFFNEILMVPYSPKKDLSIPYYILDNKIYLARFIRGLFDTDGCFVVQKDGKYSYDQIKICTSISTFAIDIKNALKILGIDSYICRKGTGFDVVIRRKESYNRFIELVQPKNNRGNSNGAAGIRISEALFPIAFPDPLV